MTAAILGALFGAFFDRLSELSGSPLFLLVILLIAFADSVVPVVPSETLVIVGGVAAGQGEQSLTMVMLCGALGAFLGDNAAYQLGASAEGLLRSTMFRGDKGDRRLAWAARQLARRGGQLLVTARFIPGGRTAVTVSSGVTGQPRRRFVLWDLLACAIWASYAALLGFVGGKTFEDNHTLALLVALAAAVGVTVLVEVVRHVHAKRNPPDSQP